MFLIALFCNWFACIHIYIFSWGFAQLIIFLKYLMWNNGQSVMYCLFFQNALGCLKEF